MAAKKRQDTLSIVVGDLWHKGEPCAPFTVEKVWAPDAVESVTLAPGELSVEYRYELRLSGRVTEHAEGMIKVDWQPVQFGGVRAYFWCPRCMKRRTMELHLHEGEPVCRKCARVTYESQYEPLHRRQLARAAAIRSELGGSTMRGQPFGRGPRGMHTSTWLRKREEALELEARALDTVEELLAHGWRPRDRRREDVTLARPSGDELDLRKGLYAVLSDYRDTIR